MLSVRARARRQEIESPDVPLRGWDQLQHSGDVEEAASFRDRVCFRQASQARADQHRDPTAICHDCCLLPETSGRERSLYRVGRDTEKVRRICRVQCACKRSVKWCMPVRFRIATVAMVTEIWPCTLCLHARGQRLPFANTNKRWFVTRNDARWFILTWFASQVARQERRGAVAMLVGHLCSSENSRMEKCATGLKVE